jgi:hypothetical protein
MALKLGVAGTNIDEEKYGGLYSAIRQIAQSDEGAAAAIAAAEAMSPATEKVDPAQLAIRFFSQMGANAAKPGSTALSAAAEALPTAADYLAQVNKRNRELERARGPLAVQLATALKPPTTGTTTLKSVVVTKPNGDTYKDFISVADILALQKKGFRVEEDTSGKFKPESFDTRTLYKDGAEIKVYNQADLDTRISEGWSEIKPKADVGFDTRTLYKDGAEIKVYNQADLDTRISEGWSEIEPKADVGFDTRTLYKDGAEIKVYNQADLDTRISEGWSEIKPKDDVGFDTRTLYKDGAEIKVYNQADLDTRISEGWSEIKPKDDITPKPNAYERLRDNAINVATQIQSNTIELIDGKLPSDIKTKLVADANKIKDVKTITINNQDGSTTEILQPGVNIRQIISQAYGVEIAELMFGKIEEPVEGSSNYIDGINIAGINFNKIGGKDGKLSTAEASALANAKNSANSLNTAFNMYFENGEYNRARAINASLAADSVTENVSVVGRLADIYAAVKDPKARSILQEMSNSIEIILRVRSGAAVPDSEVVKYQKIYMPNSLDNAEQARAKLQKLAAFVADTYDGLAKGRFARIENPNYDRNSDDPLKKSRFIYNDPSHGIVDQNTGLPLDMRNQYSTDPSGQESISKPTILKIIKLGDGRVAVTLSNNETIIGNEEDFE